MKNLDLFSKYNDDFVRRSSTGACISIFAFLLILIFISAEFALYLTPEQVHLVEASSSIGELLNIRFDVTFPKVPCSVLSVDLMDESGKERKHLKDEQVHMIRLDVKGRPQGIKEEHKLGNTVKDPKEIDPRDAEIRSLVPSGHGKDGCGSCYGAESPENECCNSCDEIREAYKRKEWIFSESTQQRIPICIADVALVDKDFEGCNYSGSVKVEKVAGNLHFALGRTFNTARREMDEILNLTFQKFDLSHRINELEFVSGNEERHSKVKWKSPLENQLRKQTTEAPGMFQYYVKIVPTENENTKGKTMLWHRYSVTEHYRKLPTGLVASKGVPGVYFFYDISPVKLRIVERDKSFSGFLSMVCAIIGGTYTVFGLLDSIVEKLITRFPTFQKKVIPL
eukprot:g148.t1